MLQRRMPGFCQWSEDCKASWEKLWDGRIFGQHLLPIENSRNDRPHLRLAKLYTHCPYEFLDQEVLLQNYRIDEVAEKRIERDMYSSKLTDDEMRTAGKFKGNV